MDERIANLVVMKVAINNFNKINNQNGTLARYVFKLVYANKRSADS